MNRNNFHTFNSKKYEELLSPFGRQVLQVLLRKWNTERENATKLRSRQYHQPVKRHRVLTFRDSHSQSPVVNPAAGFPLALPAPPPPPPPPPPNHQTSAATDATEGDPTRPEHNVDFYFTGRPTFRDDHSSTGHPKPNRCFNIDDTNENFTLDDVSVTNGHYVQDNRPGETNRFTLVDHVERSFDVSDVDADLKFSLDDANCYFLNPENRTENHTASNVENFVDWNNMFDTELLADGDAGAVSTPPPTDSTTDVHEVGEPTTDLQNPRDADKSEFTGDKMLKDTRETGKKNSKKSPKRKSISKTNCNSKKTKGSVAETKVSGGRKRKYEASVNAWLADVDPSRPVEDDGNVGTSVDVSEASNKVESIKPDKKAKKVVQAQLANKGGVMKFDKPKEQSVTGGMATAAPPAAGPPPAARRRRTKFVPPPPSQSADDFLEGVTIIDEDEVDENTFNDLENKEIFMILTYSDGSHQLRGSSSAGNRSAAGVVVRAADGPVCLLRGQGTSIGGLLMRLVRSGGGEGGGAVVCFGGKQLLMHVAGASAAACAGRAEGGLDLTHQYRIIDLEIGGSLLDADNPPADFAALERLLGLEGGGARRGAAAALQRLEGAARELQRRLHRDQLWDLFIDVEMNALPIIADMECRGVPVSLQRLRAADARLAAAAAAADVACVTAARADVSADVGADGGAGGGAFKPLSTAAVRALLFDQLKLQERCQLQLQRTPLGIHSTNETTLLGLHSGTAHPLPALIVRRRRLARAHQLAAALLRHATASASASAASAPAPDCGDASPPRVTAFLKPTWLQCSAATGRVACRAPNLQAVPTRAVPLTHTHTDTGTEHRDGTAAAAAPDLLDDEAEPTDKEDVRATTADPVIPLEPADGGDEIELDALEEAVTGSDEEEAAEEEEGSGAVVRRGRGAGALEAVALRACVVAENGYLLLSADYKQMELRVAAALAGDERLQRAIASADDIFAALAAHWLEKDVSLVSGEERGRTKQLVYGSLYGAGPRRLAQILHVPYERARDAHGSFTRAFPTWRLLQQQVAAATAAGGCGRGGARSPRGRLRRLPALAAPTSAPAAGPSASATAPSAAAVAAAQRQALNFLIQGTAADICKLAMVATARALAGLAGLGGGGGDGGGGRGARLVLQLHDELVFHLPQQHLARIAQAIREAMEGCALSAGVPLPRLPVALRVGPDWHRLRPYHDQ